jgi:hypothetical protein
MAWLKDFSWVKLTISVAAGLAAIFLINWSTRIMLARSDDYPSEEQEKSIKAFNACIIFYLIIDIFILTGFLGLKDIGGTVLRRIGFLAFLMVSTLVTMLMSRRWVPLPQKLTPWIWAGLNLSTIAIMAAKGWFGTIDPSLAASASSGLRQITALAGGADLRIVFLLVTLIGPWLLVTWLHYDLLFNRSIDPEGYRAIPGSFKAREIFSGFVETLALSLGLGLVAVWILSKQSANLGWTRLPTDQAYWETSYGVLLHAPGHFFWVMLCAFSVTITLIKALRCLLTPAQKLGVDLPDPNLEKGKMDEPDSGHYDVFISYKSQDVMTARQVAEQLIAVGVKTWFAEYQIPAAEQLKFRSASEEESKTLVSNALQGGLDASDSGLAFTNDRYAGSVYCNEELSHLLNRCGPGRVFEVMIPAETGTHQRFPQLTESPSIEYRGDINEVLAFVEGCAGWRLGRVGSNAPNLPAIKYQGLCLGQRYQLILGGWKLKDEGGKMLNPLNQQGPEFFRDVEGGRIFMNLYFGQETDASVLLHRKLHNNPDDRQAYDFILSYALNEHSITLGTQPRGAHLLSHDGLGQFGITYKNQGIWTRKYSIIIKKPLSIDMVEFVFTFASSLPNFSQLCRDAYLFDRVVTSLKWI